MKKIIVAIALLGLVSCQHSDPGWAQPLARMWADHNGHRDANSISCTEYTSDSKYFDSAECYVISTSSRSVLDCEPVNNSCTLRFFTSW